MDKIDSLVYDNVTEHVNCVHFWYFMVLGINFKNGNNGKRDLNDHERKHIHESVSSVPDIEIDSFETFWIANVHMCMHI